MGKSIKQPVLIAEDDFVSQKMVEFLFQKIGVSFDIAANGLQAIEKYKQRDYEIVFMDVNMPEMNGIESVIAIRSFEEKSKKQRCPIYVLSAAEPDDVKAEFAHLDIDGVVEKPLTDEKLKIILFNNS